MSAALALSPTDKLTGAKAFTRSLNILLKHVRLYGLAHKRSTDQFDQAWDLLQTVLTGDNGFLLGITGDKLLLDGVPLEAGPSEQSFAKTLAAAGISSIHFASSITINDFQSLVTAFANSRPSDLLNNLQLVADASPSRGFRVNEVRFVASEHADNEATMASVISARTMNELGPQVTDWLKDPRKLLQLISAAEGTKGGHGDGTASGTGDGSSVIHGAQQFEVVAAHEDHPAPLEEDEVISVIRFMQRMGQLREGNEAPPELNVLQGELAGLSANAHSVLYQMLFSTVASSFEGQEAPDLMKLAEHLAIKFAVESFERGETRINAVQQIMDRLNGELESLRHVLHSHEDKMSKAGMLVESQAEIMDRQFWAAVPDWGKKNVLLSDDGWCIPARNVRSYVEQLVERRDKDTATAILNKYLSALESNDADARRKVAGGITELADLFGNIEPGFLQQAILKVGRSLATEHSLEQQTLLGAAFVRLNQEASSKKDYVAIEQSLCSLAQVEKDLPNLARDIKPRVSVQSRLREFVSEIHHCEVMPAGLVEVLRRTPGPSTEEIATQFSRCATRPEAERYVELVQQIGSCATLHLRHLLMDRSGSEGVIGVGLLTRFDPELMLNELPSRIRVWSRQQQDSAVRQIAASGAEHRAELLLSLLEDLDPLILPEAIDEIGMAGDAAHAVPLMDLATGDGCAAGSPFVQLKAIEAVGRLRIMGAENLLIELIMLRTLMGFSQPREIRVAAMQALQSINPERARQFLAKSGLDDQELKIRPLDGGDTNWVRQRRYQRFVPNSTINATAVTAKGRCPVALERISLGGGYAVRNGRALFGNEALLEMQLGFRQLRSRVLIREAQAGVMFEIADIGLDERGRLRKLIAQMR